MVCAWHREQAVPNTEKLSAVQKRDRLYAGAQVLEQGYCMVSTTVSGRTQNKQERFARGSNARLNAYGGLLESRAEV